MPTSAQPPWSWKQSFEASTGAGTTATATPVVPLSPGSTLIAVVGVQAASPSTCTSVRDAASNNFLQIGKATFGAGSGNDTTLWALNTPVADAGLVPGITATASASGVVIIVVIEVSGIAAGTTLAQLVDGTPGTLVNTTNTATGSPTYSSSTAGQLLVACYADAGGPLTWTIPAGFNNDNNGGTAKGINSSGGGNCEIAFTASTTGQQNASWGLTGTATNWGVITVAFQLAVVPGPPVVRAPAFNVGAGPTFQPFVTYGYQSGIYPKLETLTDNFSVGTVPDATKWTRSGANVTLSGGQLQMVSPASSTTYSILYAQVGGVDRRYNLIGSYASVQLVNAGNQALASLECYPLYLTDENYTSPANKLFWYINAGGIYTFKTVGGTQSQVGSTQTYNATTHAWLRIRESGGTVFFDYSSDGRAWTNFSSTPDIPNLSAIGLWIQNGTYASEASATTCIYDNLSVGQFITRAPGFPAANTGTTTTAPVTWQMVGDLAIYAVSCPSTTSVTSVSATKTGAWTKLADYTDATDSQYIGLWTAQVTATGADTVTFTWSAGASPNSYVVDELTPSMGASSATVWTIVANGSLRSASSISYLFPSLTSGTAVLQAYWGLAWGGNVTGQTPGTTPGFVYHQDGSTNQDTFNGTLVTSTAYQPNGGQVLAAAAWAAAMIVSAVQGVLTGPNYAGAASGLSGGVGTWTNPTNADGAPDGSVATWTAP